MFWTVASVNVPHDVSDAELLDWWQQSGNRMSGVVSGLFAMCAATLLAVVANHVHRLDATRTSPMWRAFARSMAVASRPPCWSLRPPGRPSATWWT